MRATGTGAALGISQHMLRDFLTWWIGQLADSIPEGWRRFSPSGDALVIAPVGPLANGVETVAASLRRNGKETPLGRFGTSGGGLAGLPRPNGKPAVLQLGEADVLRKTVTLPLAAERHLDQVLAFEMERETPFRADEIFWNHSVAERDRQRGQLSVRLLLIPRENLSALLGALSHAGILPKRAEIGRDQGCYLPLDADGGRLHDSSGARFLRWPAVALCGGLAAAAIAMPFVTQSFALAQLDQKIAAGREAAAEAENLRREIEHLSGTADLIESERDKAGRPLATLAALTSLLPDDTFLTELQLQQQKVIVSGRSASASRLIGALATGNHLRNPACAAKVSATATHAHHAEGLAAGTSVEIGSREARAPENRGAYRRIGLRLAVSGQYESAVKLLSAIETAAPPLIIANLQLHGALRPRAEPSTASIDAAFEVFGFRRIDTSVAAKQ